ncbi:ATP-binding protein [Paenibacillus sp. 481]|uniref:ATP-binding protein n=1 Tax=Paenibacillus sp. 481 TaxID=2835869 RepID=UPI001E575E01|nr:ATP-binding protein [Paenibacillus sp. 481]UHA75277.1 PAS domain S-box protein [Paenibacillus sp. 481]
MRLSIKAKLSIFISCTVLLALLMHMIVNYYTTKSKLTEEIEQRMRVTAQQIDISVKQARHAAQLLDEQLAEKLYVASVHIASKLPPDIEDVRDGQLTELSKELRISHISLLSEVDNGQDIVVKKSSDGKEMGLSTKKWSYWYTAFQQLLKTGQVTVSEGQKFHNFWAGPIDRSSSDPDYNDKWGYYYDHKRNYIINPYLRNESIQSFFDTKRIKELTEKTKETQANVLEITAFNPQTIGKGPKVTRRSDGQSIIRPEDSVILYGSHEYEHALDKKYVHEAMANESVFVECKVDGGYVLKGFYRMQDKKPYVLTIVMDGQALASTLHDQLMQSIAVGIVLLEIVLVGSYLLAGMLIRPVQAIVQKVNMISVGHFSTRLNVERKDELGILAARINAMARNLNMSTDKMRTLYEENRTIKEQLESFINQSNDAIHVNDLSGRVQRVNQAFVDMFGWSMEDVLDMPLSNIPEQVLEEELEAEQLLRSGQNIGARETLRLTRDGRLLDVSVSTSPIYNERGECVAWASIIRDMTSRKRMEELLRRSEKLTTVGQLAAGVAHEIRNPLTTLRGFLQLQQQTKHLNSGHVNMMLSELDRINLIVSEFLILAKPQAVRFQPKDVRIIMGEVMSLLDSQAHLLNIGFVKRFSEDVPLVECEENQLKQVFINVIKNAMEAISDGGKVELSIDSSDEGNVIIVIEDNGIGIPQDHLSRLGDPFFTNKEKGTGLGLMVSQRIIHNHKGTFDIMSEEDCGTSVTIRLPAIDNSQARSRDLVVINKMK